VDPMTVSSILAPAALLALTASLAMAAVAGTPNAHQLRALLLARGRWLAFAVAATALLGSLYYSEVAHFVPCEMCWLQRIAMYPLAVILLVAAITRDERAWRYAVPLAAIGLLFSLYHYQLELFPDQPSMCSTTVPCSARYFAIYGFVSISFMAGAGFISILALHLAMARARRAAGR